jgi:drug/metabolite transporter (DMT)-like permease
MTWFRSASQTTRGIVAMVLATALFCCGDAMMKLAATLLPTTQTMFVRSSTSAALVLSFAWITGAFGEIRRGFSRAMAFRAGSDVTASLLFQAALGRMHFADIMAVLQVSPLTLTAGSALFLGEKVGWRRWSAVAVGLLGALLIVKPGTSSFNWWAIAAILSVIGGAARDISTRRIDPLLPTSLILGISAVVVSLGSLAGALVEQWHVPDGITLFMLLCAGICSMLGQVCVITAVRSAEISVVAPFRYAGIVWALILDLAIWSHFPDAWAMVGIVAVSSAGIYTFYRERVLQRQSARRVTEIVR